MKIAIFSDTFPPQVNGVASVVRDSANALAAELGHDVVVFTVRGKTYQGNTERLAFRREKNTVALRSKIHL